MKKANARLQKALQKFKDSQSRRFEPRRSVANAVITSVERDSVTGHTTGIVRATIDGIPDQNVFVGSGQGFSIGSVVRVENRGGSFSPDWTLIGRVGSVAGAEGTLDIDRTLSTPTGVVLSTDAYTPVAGAGIFSSVTVTFNQNQDYESVASYDIQWFKDSEGASTAQLISVPHVVGQATNLGVVGGLLPSSISVSQSYSFRVRAKAYSGAVGGWTEYSAIETAADPTAPSTPTGLSAVAIDDYTLRLYWTANSEPDFSYYVLDVSANGGTAGRLTGYPRTVGNQNEFILGVTPNVSRYFAVKAVDATGNESSYSSFAGPFKTENLPSDAGLFYFGPTIELVANLTNAALTMDVNFNILEAGWFVHLVAPNGTNEIVQINTSTPGGSAVSNGDGYRYNIVRAQGSTTAQVFTKGTIGHALTTAGFIQSDVREGVSNTPTIRMWEWDDPYTDAWADKTLRVALGNLGGITDPVLGSLSGYGLYSDNVYLTGQIIAQGGAILGSLEIDGGDIIGGGGAVTINDDGITIVPGDSVVNKIVWNNGTFNTAEIVALVDTDQQEIHSRARQYDNSDTVIAGIEATDSIGVYYASVQAFFDGASHARLGAYSVISGLKSFVEASYESGVGYVTLDPGLGGEVLLPRGVHTDGNIWADSSGLNIGTVSQPFNALYVNSLYADSIVGTPSGLEIGVDVQAWDADLDAIAGLAKSDGNFIVGNGTTWVAESGSTARASLGLAIGSNVQAWDADLDAIAALAKTDGNFIVGNGTTWVAESGNTARTSLALGTSNSPTFAGLTINGNIAVTGTVDGVDVADHSARHESGGADAINHDSLTGFVANEHIDHTAVTIGSGNGLTGGGTIAASRTINVGAGAGITVNANDVALTTPGSLSATSTNSSSGNHTHAIDSTIARSAIQIIAGNGLTGGGNLTANRTLNVGAGAGITVNANDVALTTPGSLSATSTNSSSGNHTHAIDSTIARSAIQIIAGNGLTGGGNLTANRTLNVGAGNGISVAADSVAVNQAYAFSWTGLHTFNEHTEMESVDVNGALTVTDDLTVTYGGFSPLFVNVDTVNPNNSNVGIMTNSPDPQFALDVNGPLRAQYLIGPHAIQLSDAALIAHFDGPYPFETNYDGFAAGHLGQVATTTGGVIYRPGKFGKAVQLAEATTNLVTNPSFEGWDGANPNGWSLVNSPTIAQSSESMYGSLGARVTNNSTALDRGLWVEVSGLTIGLTYTFSAWVYNIVGQSRIRVFQGGSFTTGIATSSYTSGSGWQRLSVSFAAPTTSVRVLLAATSAGADCVYDAIQIEEKAYATPFCSGDLGLAPGQDQSLSENGNVVGGHSWSGTAHASTSSRTAASLTYATANNIDATVCTVMAWVYATNTAGYQTILRANGSSATYIILRYNAGATQYQAFWGGNAITGGTAKFNQWVHLAATFDGSTVTLYENGVEVASGAAGTAFAGMPTVMHIGDRPAGGHNLNGYLDDLVILSRAADAAEIRSIYESNAPVFAESSIEVWRTPTQVPIWVDSEGLWMRAVGGGETLGAYGGDATKSWGGKTLYQSDFLLGNATDGYIHWHAYQDTADPYGAAGMEIRARVDVLGESQFIGAVTLGASGGIYQGTGTFASPTTGLKIWSDSSVGRIAGYNAGTIQWYAGTDGRLYAGAGNVKLDSEGLWMRAVGGGETLGAYGGDATKSWGGKTLYQSDFLLGNATDGYIHWHAFQDDSDPWGAAGMEVKAQVDIIGNSTVSGVLSVTGEFSVIDGTTKLFVTQDYLLAGNAAGVDETSFAVIFANGTMVGTDPMSPTYDAGDVLIGDELNTNILWDQSAGRMNFRNGTTVEAYVEDGTIFAGGGVVKLDSNGFSVQASTTYAQTRSLEFVNGSDVRIAGIYGTVASNDANIWVESFAEATGDAYAALVANSAADQLSEVTLSANDGTTSTQLIVRHPATGQREVEVTSLFRLAVISEPGSGVNPATGAWLFIDTGGDLKVKFANGTVKTIATN